MRQEALQWWSEISAGEKIRLWTLYCTEKFSPSLRPSELTGREIEFIYSNIYIIE